MKMIAAVLALATLPWFSLQSQADPYIINVLDYGAKCDFNPVTQTGTDDSSAFNAATAAARAINSSGDIMQPATIISPSNKFCLIKSPVNFTGFNRPGITVVFGMIHCAATGQICLDATGSRFIEWYVNLYGDTVNVPKIGVQVGRINTASADDMNFNKLDIEGFFSQASLYNYASESTNHKGSYIWNRNPASGAYSVILDGCGFWNPSSSFVTITNSPGVRQPMGGVSFDGAKLLNSAPNSSVWVGCTTSAKFDHTYIAATGSSSQVVTLWQSDAQGNDNIYFDIGAEKQVTDMFLITGPYITPIFGGLYLRSAGFEPINSIFKLDTGITSATCLGCTVVAPSFYNTASTIPKVFDNAALWTFTGNVSVGNSSMWVQPSIFSGTICLPTSCATH